MMGEKLQNMNFHFVVWACMWNLIKPCGDHSVCSCRAGVLTTQTKIDKIFYLKIGKQLIEVQDWIQGYFILVL